MSSQNTKPIRERHAKHSATTASWPVSASNIADRPLFLETRAIPHTRFHDDTDLDSRAPGLGPYYCLQPRGKHAAARTGGQEATMTRRRSVTRTNGIAGPREDGPAGGRTYSTRGRSSSFCPVARQHGSCVFLTNIASGCGTRTIGWIRGQAAILHS